MFACVCVFGMCLRVHVLVVVYVYMCMVALKGNSATLHQSANHLFISQMLATLNSPPLSDSSLSCLKPLEQMLTKVHLTIQSQILNSSTVLSVSILSKPITKTIIQ